MTDPTGPLSPAGSSSFPGCSEMIEPLDDLLILGASARAAAASSLRIGLRPRCVDLFADLDLVASCPATRVEPADYPDGLARAADRIAPGAWLYTGALENRPDLVDRISSRHRLLGNPGPILRAVRDPIALAGAFRDAGIRPPGVTLGPAGLPVDGSWLRKPIASGGGRGIRPWRGSSPEPGPGVYFQEWVDGLSLAALFVCHQGKARCLGITRQYVGKPGNRFAYRGTLAPWPVVDELRDRIERLGSVVGQAFGLVGLFGIDLIVADGEPRPIEVNPRYTASVEVLERAGGRSLLAEHLLACGVSRTFDTPTQSPTGFAAKAIIHARGASRWEGDGIDPGADSHEFPELGDIPRRGTTFRAGEPVVTVFAGGESPEACRKALAVRVAFWRRRLVNEPG